MENYVYLVVFHLKGYETHGNGSIFKEGFIERDKVEETLERIENDLMEDYDGYEVIEPLKVMQKGGICNFNF